MTGWLQWPSSSGTKNQADSVFLEAMTVLRVPLWRRRLMYLAVRLFGRGAYVRRADAPEPGD
ncbi:DUF1353 domain-containing protein [Pseudoxanthomonas sp. UTMC 1351]|uniref:DUF1353 domain-containing protein n=1 Tax=Pseudoxanthomonas sp. UTMC 1351 TaxID=2695853 RepID=UPI0034CF6B9F